MPIISVSMTEEDLENLDQLKVDGEFSNRSDAVRHAVQALMVEHRNVELAAGEITAIITAVYYKKGQRHNINSVQHKFRDIITATIHAHTADGYCTEIMIVTTDAENVRKFLKELRSQKKVMKTNISLVGGGT